MSVFSSVPGSFTFGHGLGLVFTGFNEWGGSSINLVYARVGEQEYGEVVRLDTEAPDHIGPADGLEVYPNPARQTFTVTYRLTAPGPVALQVYDVLGREVMHRRLGNRSPGEHNEAIDVGRLTSGTYLIALNRQGGTIATQSVVVAD